MTHELPFTENNLRDMMIASARKGGIYSPAGQEKGKGMPKPTNSQDGIADQALSMPHTQRRDLILRLAKNNGVTVRDLVAASDLPVKKASHALSAQKGRGYLKIFGYADGKCGNKINIYVLTDKGRELLGRIGG